MIKYEQGYIHWIMTKNWTGCNDQILIIEITGWTIYWSNSWKPGKCTNSLNLEATINRIN